MIERLLVQNFQAHQRLRVDFDQRITTLVGSTDKGKSAIIRALRWVLTNQPAGDAFVRHGTKGALVQAVVDGHKIKRRRGTSINAYELDGKELKAFGRGVPDVVERLANMPRICWQLQHDSAYWFGDSAGEVSRQLNQIVNLGIIDDTLTNVGRKYNAARAKVEAAEETLTEAKEAHDALSWVPAYSKEVDNLVALSEAAEQAEEAATTLQALTEAVGEGRQQVKVAKEAAKASEVVVELAEVCRGVEVRVMALNIITGQIRGAIARLEKPVPATDAMDTAVAAYDAAVGKGKPLGRLVAEIKKQQEQLCQAERKAKETADALPVGICPECGRSL